ncbi:hypothetical protein M569_14967, partial [Genlisea aurea]
GLQMSSMLLLLLSLFTTSGRTYDDHQQALHCMLFYDESAVLYINLAEEERCLSCRNFDNEPKTALI